MLVLFLSSRHETALLVQESANHIKNALTLVTDIIVKLKGNTIADIRHAIHADADEEDGNANQTPMEASDEDEVGRLPCTTLLLLC